MSFAQLLVALAEAAGLEHPDLAAGWLGSWSAVSCLYNHRFWAVVLLQAPALGTSSVSGSLREACLARGSVKVGAPWPWLERRSQPLAFSTCSAFLLLV